MDARLVRRPWSMLSSSATEITPLAPPLPLLPLPAPIPLPAQQTTQGQTSESRQALHLARASRAPCACTEYPDAVFTSLVLSVKIPVCDGRHRLCTAMKRGGRGDVSRMAAHRSGRPSLPWLAVQCVDWSVVQMHVQEVLVVLWMGDGMKSSRVPARQTRSFPSCVHCSQVPAMPRSAHLMHSCRLQKRH